MELSVVSPNISQEHQRFWAAANEGRLLIKSCGDCGEAHWYPRVFCPFCASDNTMWVEASGRGRIYSYSIVSGKMPTSVAYVTLDEGVTMATLIAEAEPAKLAVGAEVRVSFCMTDGGQSVPVFELSTHENNKDKTK